MSVIKPWWKWRRTRDRRALDYTLRSSGLWLRSDTNVTPVAGDVSAWVDRFERGGAATQAVAGTRPPLIVSDPDFAGYPSIDGVGTGKYLNLTFDTGTSAVTIWCVVHPTATGAVSSYVWDANGADRTILATGRTGLNATAVFDGVGWRAGAATTAGTQQIVYCLDTNNIRIRRDGIVIGTYGTYAHRRLLNGPLLPFAGARLRIAEMAVWLYDLPDAEIGAVESYGAKRYLLPQPPSTP